MTIKSVVTLDEATASSVASVLATNSESLAEMASLGGLDPASAFVGLDLRGWPLKNVDVRGVNLSDCDLRGTGIEAAISDYSTVLAGAILDKNARRALRIAPPPPQPSVRSPRPKPPPGGYTKVRLPTLTDAEMLEQEFLISEPAKLDQIVQDAPPVDEWLTYEGRYEIGQAIACAFGHRHKKGYVFRDETGGRYLIGHNCGQQHFSLGKWEDFTNGRKGLEDRASYLRLIRDLGEAFEAHLDWINSAPKSAEVREYDRLRAVLRVDLPDLAAAIREVTGRPERRLIVSVQERDYTAEDNHRERLRKAREKLLVAGDINASKVPMTVDPIFRTVDKQIGTFNAVAIISGGVTVAERLRVIGELVGAFSKRPSITYKKKELIEVSKNARHLLDRLEQVAKELDEAASFFALENMQIIAQWASDRLGNEYEVNAKPGGLILSTPSGKRVEWVRAETPEFDREPIRQIRRAVQGVSRRIG